MNVADALRTGLLVTDWRPAAAWPRAARLMAADPTGLSSPIGRLVILAGLIAALVVLIAQWRRRR